MDVFAYKWYIGHYLFVSHEVIIRVRFHDKKTCCMASDTEHGGSHKRNDVLAWTTFNRA